MGEKRHPIVHVLFQNIGGTGFLTEDKMEVKLEAMHRVVMDQSINILGFMESNTSWDLLPGTGITKTSTANMRLVGDKSLESNPQLHRK